MLGIKKYIKKQETYKIIKAILFLILIILLLIAIVAYIRADNDKRRRQLLFFMLQYVAMLALMLVSVFVKRKWDIKIPILLDASFVTVGFCAFILGDVVNLYGHIYLWDNFIHFLSGMVIALVGYFIINVAVKHERITVSLSPLFLCIAIVLFAVSLAAIWEMGEYIYDDIFETNTQQFMENTTESIINDEDIPLEGHEALKDTMHDLMLDLAGSLIVSVGVYKYEKREKIPQNM